MCSWIRNSFKCGNGVHCARGGQEAPKNRDSQILQKDQRVSERPRKSTTPAPDSSCPQQVSQVFSTRALIASAKNSPAILPLAKIIPRLN